MGNKQASHRRYDFLLGVMIAITLGMVVLWSCTPPQEPPPGGASPRSPEPFSLDPMEQAWIQNRFPDKILPVASVELEDTFYRDETGEWQGLHTDLARIMARDLGLEAVFVPVSFDDLFLRNGATPADLTDPDGATYTPDIFQDHALVAFDLGDLPWRRRLMDLVPVYPSRMVLITPKGKEVRQLGDLQDRKAVIYRATSHESRLNFLNQGLDLGMDILALPFGADRFKLMEEGTADMTVADAQRALKLVPRHPDLDVSLAISEAHMNSWGIARNQEPWNRIVRRWMDRARVTGILDEVWSREYQISMATYQGLIGWSDDRRISVLGPGALNSEEQALVSTLRQQGGLRVAMDHEISIHETDKDGRIRGLHYNLVLAMGAALNLPVHIETVNFQDFFTNNGVIPPAVRTLENYTYTPDLLGRVDLYASTLTPLPWREKFLSFIPIYPTKLVWALRSENRTKGLAADPSSVISLLPNSSYQYWLEEKGYLDRHPMVLVDSGTEAIELVDAGLADLTLSDANLMFGRINLYNEMTFYPADEEVDNLSWAVAPESRVLHGLLTRLVQEFKEDGTFERLWKEYYRVGYQEYLSLLFPSATGANSP